MKYLLVSLIFLFLLSPFANAKNNDYHGSSFLNENLKIGLGLAYSKLETSTAVGNYFLLSQANPRLEMNYDTGVQNEFRQRYSLYVKRELFRPENNQLVLRTKTEHTNYGLAWSPMWVSEGQGYSYGFKFAAKAGSIISEIPNTFYPNGDIGTRYSAEGGIAYSWYGETVAKFPLSLNFEVLYSQSLLTNSIFDYYNGFIYRFSLEFDFKKKTIFSGWNLRAYYEYEDIATSNKNMVDKDLGIVLCKVFTF